MSNNIKMPDKNRDMSYAFQNNQGPRTAHDLLFNTHGYHDRSSGNPIVRAKMHGNANKMQNQHDSNMNQLGIPSQGAGRHGNRRLSISGTEIGSFGSSFRGTGFMAQIKSNRKIKNNASMFKKNQAPPVETIRRRSILQCV